jgi:hypothetical protein
MRVSPWAVKFNIGILPATIIDQTHYYRVNDIFTTRDSSWEVSSVEGSITDWARSTYLKPWGHEDYFDDAGGDHHLFGGVYNEATGRMEKTASIRYYTWTDNGNSVLFPVKTKSGWANNVIWNSFNPDLDLNTATGERGAWAWRPELNGIPAETVVGGGMPFKWHVSFFATWTLEPVTVTPPIDDEARIAALESWARQVSAYWKEAPQYA